ncbi:translation initiation factor IF-2 [Rapidithrix thailandica]|uniref:Translation initiation factor IF-2 n=1 Tax=Rapidithrix thailandica TaxID=413964 RepID=A0AAW9S4A3_9BACT
MIRLIKAAKELNVGIHTIAEHLASKGFKVDSKPNSKITQEQFDMLVKDFHNSMEVKQEASVLTIGSSRHNVVIESDQKSKKEEEEEDEFFILDKSAEGEEEEEQTSTTETVEETTSTPEEELPATKEETPVSTVEETVPQEQDKTEEVPSQPEETPTQEVEQRPSGLKVIGKIDLEQFKKTKSHKKKVAKEEPPKKEKAPEEVQKQTEQPEEKPSVHTQEEKAAPIAEEHTQKTPETTTSVEPVIEQKEASQEDKATPVEKDNTAIPETKKEEPVQESTQPVATQEDQPQDTQEPIEEPSTEKDSGKPTPQVSEDEPAKKEMIKEKQPEVEPKETSDAAQEETATQEIEGEGNVIEAKADKLKGLKVVGKIELPTEKSRKKQKPVASSDDKQDEQSQKKRKRKRVKVQNKRKPQGSEEQQQQQQQQQKQQAEKKSPSSRRKKKGAKTAKEEVSQKEVQESYKKTLAKMGGGATGGKSTKRHYKKEKRTALHAAREARKQRELDEAKVLKVTEFISANELATLMSISVNQIISQCLSMGMFVSINQRLDAETITIIADEFGFDVDFTSAEEEIEVVLEETDKEEDLAERAPIVTIMGHVDHGKTSLLDYIRSATVAEGEAGGITQHIGAYDVTTESGRRIAFLDTPGHEAFTAMRARGAKVTDVVIIVIAADDSVMPQTVEAINHAQVAGVPIVFAINKVDKPTANPHKIKEELANMNLLVEDWGGKYQCYEISAKSGKGIDDLLEGVLLESDVLELKANPNKNANGTVVEASLDKGRGYVTTVLVQSGTLNVGDIILAGHHYGRVKAMTDHRGKRLKKAGPSTPVQMLGLNGAPQAGDKLNALDSEREAREIATKREQIIREQSIRATKRTTLSDIGKRIAIGNFQQLNIILKGDVDGSVEALSDSLLKLSTDEVEVNIIHKAVGPLSESDILLATASEAVVIGFQVRPTPSAKKLAEKEDVEVRLYSVIYDAINDVKAAMEGMLAPDIEEIIVGNVEIRETFKISKIGTVAGCYVVDGYVKRNSKIRVVRDGIVIYGGDTGGEIAALKRFKDDVNEVKQGFECGMSVKNFNDIKVGDIIEAFEEREVKRSLK